MGGIAEVAWTFGSVFVTHENSYNSFRIRLESTQTDSNNEDIVSQVE